MLRNFRKFVQISRKNYINGNFSGKSTNFSPKISSTEAVRVKFIENFKKYSLTNFIKLLLYTFFA